ncbi:MAG: Asp/Glu/hydantoin racemase, partial [Castellaniella sp.]
VTEPQILTMASEVCASRPDALTMMCTNVRAAQLAPRIEASLGVPFYDSVSTVVWQSLRMAGYDTREVQGWGPLFLDVA